MPEKENEQTALSITEHQEPLQPVQSLTIEELITREASRYTATPQRAKELKKLYGKLKIEGPEDKKGYEAVKKALSVVRPERTQIEKDRKMINERTVALKKGVDDRSKELEALYREVEEPLQAEKDRIDDLKAQEEIKAAEERKKREGDRINILHALGCWFDGTFYGIGNNPESSTTIAQRDIADLPDNMWAIFQQKVKDEAADIKAKKEEEERKKKEQEEEDQRKRDELAQQQKELEQAKQKIKDARVKMRTLTLQSNGYVLSSNNTQWEKRMPVEGSNTPAFTFILASDVADLEDDDFFNVMKSSVADLDSTFKKLTDEVAQNEREQAAAKKAEESRQAKEKRNADRSKELADMGFELYSYRTDSYDIKTPSGEVSVAGTAIRESTEEQWKEVLLKVQGEIDDLNVKEQARIEQVSIDNKRKADEEAQKRLKEADEKRKKALAELPEADQISAYIQALKAVEGPAISGLLLPFFNKMSTEINNAFEYMKDAITRVKNAAAPAGEGNEK